MITLDSLLDTRLSIIDKVGKTWTRKVLRSGKYLDRTSDRFGELVPGFPQVQYQQYWDARKTEDVMGNVYPTGLNACIAELMVKLIEDSASSPFNGHAEITINTHPYEMDDKGKELLVAMIENNFGCVGNTCSVHMNYLTPEYLASLYDDVYMYEFDKWLTMHHTSLMNTPVPELFVYAPLITARETPRKYDIMDDREFMESNWSAHMQLRYLSASTYSMCIVD